MAVHMSKTKTGARKLAKRMRTKGLNCSYKKLKGGKYGVYTDQKGRR